MLDGLPQNLPFLDFPEGGHQGALKRCQLNNTASYPRIFNLYQQAVSLKLHTFIRPACIVSTAVKEACKYCGRVWDLV
jgi:hypothetical protein